MVSRPTGRGQSGARREGCEPAAPLTGRVKFALVVLGVLIFSKYFYLASLTNYYTFYLIQKFHLSVQGAQLHLFLFLFAVAVGTVVGRSRSATATGADSSSGFPSSASRPFTIALPHANLLWTGILTVIIGLILASAFSAILVYAQELVPGKVG